VRLLFAAAACLLGSALVAQAPVVRRPPPMNGPQAPASDDEPEQQAPAKHAGTIHVQSHLVNVAVNVVDETGAPVGGLGRDDFEVFEDNQPQKVAIFEKDSATPLAIVLAIDASLSVFGDERLERNAAKHFVNALLRPEDELDLMDFADTVREIVPFTSDKRRIERGLGQIEHGNETALYDAIYLAADRLATTRQDNGQRRVMVLITDGVDTAKSTNYLDAVAQAQRAGAMVYSIIIVPVEADAGRSTGGEHALIQMAADTGGKYYYVEDPKDLEPAFAHVSDDLRTQYLLGYYAPQQTEAGAFHRIGVRLRDPGLRAKYRLRYRTGYYGAAR